jgi:hypothetical protein
MGVRSAGEPQVGVLPMSRKQIWAGSASMFSKTIRRVFQTPMVGRPKTVHSKFAD